MKKESIVEQQLDAGIKAFHEYRFQQAELHFYQAYDLDPDDFTALFNLARTQFHLDKIHAAKQKFEKAVREYPELVSNWLHNNTTCIEAIEFEHKSYCLIEPLTETETDHNIFRLLGEIFYEIRNWEEASHCFEESLKLEPGDAELEEMNEISRKNCHITSH